jgi:hypothetical protein
MDVVGKRVGFIELKYLPTLPVPVRRDSLIRRANLTIAIHKL